ncbi:MULTISPECIES: hypothetical protein [Burkholderia cepacia complex]|uniref:hypothetical protein n=1 Tax=Burkholderia cepacia complex TaxID=87882 RepID=UPI000B231E4E|nr:MULTISPECIES: hypothetical protein [Burkholderia cepacia complex]MBR8033584.1 hypothetical protein [Burkholderia vietnamiensis]
MSSAFQALLSRLEISADRMEAATKANKQCARAYGDYKEEGESGNNSQRLNMIAHDQSGEMY